MAEISHLAEARTRLSWPKMITFCFHVKAAEVAAEVTSRAAVSTKMVAGRSISAHQIVTALQFFLFMFLCTYSTILDLGYVNFLACEGNCARTSISGVDATICLQFIGNAVNSNEAKLHSIFPEPSLALVACIRDACSATSLQQKESTDIGGNGHLSREVSVATLTALARRSLNIEILRDPEKGKCISSIPRRAEFIFKRLSHFEQFLDADTKNLF
jgi:hypothetical protein